MVEERQFYSAEEATTTKLTELIDSIGFKQPDRIKKQSQFCGLSRGSLADWDAESVMKLYDKLVKLGILPDSAILRALFQTFVDLLTAASGGGGEDAIFYSALGQSFSANQPVGNAVTGYAPLPAGYFVPYGLVHYQPYTFIPSSASASPFYPSAQYQPQAAPQSFIHPANENESVLRAKFSSPSDIFNRQLGFRTMIHSDQQKLASTSGSPENPLEALRKHNPANDPVLAKLLALEIKK